MSSVKLTIAVITYNQENYIVQALQSVQEQKIDVPFEILVCDDASTDGTVKTIQSFFDKNWSGFTNYTIVANDKNIGISRNYRNAFHLSKGDYVAILEGDDYWAYKYKLKRQIEVLDSNPIFSYCASRIVSKIEALNTFQELPHNVVDEQGMRWYSINEVISNYPVGNFSACVYRKKHLLKIPDYIFDHKVYDWFINIYLAQFGLLAFLTYPMSVYRKHQAGSWSQIDYLDKKREVIRLAQVYDQLLNYKYTNDFSAVIEKTKREVFKLSIKQRLRFIKRLAVKLSS